MTMRPITITLTGLAAGSLVLAAVAIPYAAQSDPADDPATAPLPTFVDGASDPAKSVVVRADFASRTEATVADAAVSIERAHSHVGDPPIMHLVLEDGDGGVIDTLNAWSPLWVFTFGDTERLEVQESGSGSFIVPFSPELAGMRVVDVALDEEVLDVDLTGPIRDFCVANPDDPDCLEADLAVTAVSASGPLFTVVGDTAAVSVSSTVENLGPDGPVDAEATRSVTADPGLSVVPSDPTVTDVAGLAVGSPRDLDADYEIECTEPGTHDVTFRTEIAPELATVVDAEAANDALEETFSVDCAIPVKIDVQPGSTRNPVRLNGGDLPVGVLTTGAGEYGLPYAFDATKIVVSTVQFGSETALLSGIGVGESHGRLHPTDVVEPKKGDGDLDAMLHFAPRRDSLLPTDAEACVFGRFADGSGGTVAFLGCDVVDVR
ncbi:hypothetical protein ACFPER_06025 [Agromyces aurantiacus]|uniref:CARDB domain-containing protein n=1 Tax=Agromyces aurantiacus TaxID=165814 RepID=A0ABV9R3G6_9MICO|nr:hypothetical protein [Agromyces aurantiacus]MBM7503019.1 hypothetical protein [Agromyces aurantiacus]